MKTDLESCITDEKLMQDMVGNNKSTNQPNLYNLHWHSRQQNHKDFGKTVDATDTAKFAKTCSDSF